MTSISELRQRLLHPYYIVHFLYGTFYIVMRLNRMFKEQTLDFDVSCCLPSQKRNNAFFKKKYIGCRNKDNVDLVRFVYLEVLYCSYCRRIIKCSDIVYKILHTLQYILGYWLLVS